MKNILLYVSDHQDQGKINWFYIIPYKIAIALFIDMAYGDFLS